jgi:hypothetical protein
MGPGYDLGSFRDTPGTRPGVTGYAANPRNDQRPQKRGYSSSYPVAWGGLLDPAQARRRGAVERDCASMKPGETPGEAPRMGRNKPISLRGWNNPEPAHGSEVAGRTMARTRRPCSPSLPALPPADSVPGGVPGRRRPNDRAERSRFVETHSASPTVSGRDRIAPLPPQLALAARARDRMTRHPRTRSP